MDQSLPKEQRHVHGSGADSDETETGPTGSDLQTRTRHGGHRFSEPALCGRPIRPESGGRSPRHRKQKHHHCAADIETDEVALEFQHHFPHRAGRRQLCNKRQGLGQEGVQNAELASRGERRGSGNQSDGARQLRDRGQAEVRSEKHSRY